MYVGHNAEYIAGFIDEAHDDKLHKSNYILYIM